MPRRTEYEGLTLADAIRKIAEHHSAARTRHLSQDEYELLSRAADVIERASPDLAAFA
jgi:hypothetical protein